jgi:hypothetical protein
MDNTGCARFSIQWGNDDRITILKDGNRLDILEAVRVMRILNYWDMTHQEGSDTSWKGQLVEAGFEPERSIV